MKRFLCVFILAAMLLSSGVYAADVEDVKITEAYAPEQNLMYDDEITSDQLKNALDIVKGKLEVSSEFVKMDYSLGSKYISATWQNAEGDKTINVTFDTDGWIEYYYYKDSTPYEGEKGIPVYNEEQSLKIAEQFCEKAADEDLKNCKLSSTSSDSNEYKFVYQQYFNNIPARDREMVVKVNRYRGCVTRFDNYTEYASEFTIQDNVISLEDAKQRYLDEFGVNLKYIFVSDDESGKTKAVPVYSISGNSKYIDAVTGDVVQYRDEETGEELYDNEAEEDASDSASGGSRSYSNLSDEEIAKAEEISDLIGVDKAASIVKQYFPIIKDCKVKSHSVSRINNNAARTNEDAVDYYYTIQFDNAMAMLNAKTGEITYFNSYFDSGDWTNKDFTYDDAAAMADSLTDDIASGIKSNLSLVESEYSDMSYGCTVYYNRLYDGIVCRNNGVRVSFDKNGNIRGYNKTWTNAEFVSAANVMSQKEAFDIYDDALHYGLEYEDLGIEYGLVYNFNNSAKFSYIDALTGEKLDYSGKKYVDEQKSGTYTDISDHWCREVVETLASMGRYLEGTEFRPDDPLTAGDYEQLFNRTADIEDKEHELTRYEIAEYIVKSLDMDTIAAQNDIFVQPFDDVESDKYGIAAICRALGIINGTGGKFNGDDVVTRAEAAQMLYNLLKVK